MSTPEDSGPPSATPPETPAPAPEVASGSAPDDANDLRGFHFKRLLSSKLTWALTSASTIAAGVAAAIFVGAAVGGGAAVAVFLISLLVVFAIADSRAEEAFFQVYAQQRGLELGGRAPLPPTTPLLRKGDDRYAERTLSGPIARRGRRHPRSLYLRGRDRATATATGRPTTTTTRSAWSRCRSAPALVPELYCQRKFGLRALEKFEDVFRRSKERVKLESEVARREVRDLRRQETRTPTGCAASSPPPSSSG